MAFALGIALNLAFVAVEAGVGLSSGSMALVADAGHNLSDVLALVIAWGASALAARPPDRFTYGFKSSSDPCRAGQCRAADAGARRDPGRDDAPPG